MLKKLFIGIAALTLFAAIPFSAYAQTEEADPSLLYQTTSDTVQDALDKALDSASSYDYSDYYDYLDSSYDYSDEAAAAGAAAALLGGTMAVVSAIISGVVGLGMYIYYSLALMKIAQKLNVPNPWFAWVPILNMILMAKMGEVNPWLLLLMLIPGVNAFFMIYFAAVTYMKICEKRGLDKYVGLLVFVPIANVILPGYLAWANITPKQN